MPQTEADRAEALREFMDALRACKELLKDFGAAANDMWTIMGCIADSREVDGTPVSSLGHAVAGKLNTAVFGVHLLALRSDVSALVALAGAIGRIRIEASPTFKTWSDVNGKKVDAETVAKLHELYDGLLPRISGARDCLDMVYLEGLAAEVNANLSDNAGGSDGRPAGTERECQSAPASASASDLDAYIPAKACRTDNISTHKRLLTALKNNPKIRKQSNGRRLLVHGGDWHRYSDSQDKAAFEGLDADAESVEALVENSKARQAKIREEKHSAGQQTNGSPIALATALNQSKKP